jgi:enamine deaminase RidA (YjgF/YER057c/UK114 family)
LADVEIQRALLIEHVVAGVRERICPRALQARHAARCGQRGGDSQLRCRIPDAPSSPLYSQAVKVGSTIYVTGVPGVDPQTKKAAGPTIQEQTRHALTTCEKICAPARDRSRCATSAFI